MVAFSACNKEDFQPDLNASPGWEPEIAFPLAYSEIGIQDLAHINDSSINLEIDANQLCTIIYDGTIFDMMAAELLQLPDQSQQSQFSLNNSEILTLSNNGQVQLTVTEDVQFSISQGALLDSIVLKNGNLLFEFDSDFHADVDIQVTIPGMKRDGIPFSRILNLDYNGNTPVSASGSFSLTGYHADLSKNGTTTNTLPVTYSITVRDQGATVTTANAIHFTTGIQSMQFKSVYGYLGQHTVGNLQDSIELSIYQNALGAGSFSIVDPKIRFDIGNSAGIPFAVRISQLKAVQSFTTSFTVISGIPDPLPVQSPVMNQEGQTLYSNFQLDNSNSNFSSIISDQPHYLVAASQVTINPAGAASNFLTDSSRLLMNARVELPLHGTAENFRIRDTVPFNYSDLENVERLTLRISVENWFPLDAGVKLVFTNSNFQPLDTVFVDHDAIIPSGIITGTDERVTVAGSAIIDESFDMTRIAGILDASHIIVDATASTFNQGSQQVKIFSDYRLKLKFGAIVKMKIF